MVDVWLWLIGAPVCVCVCVSMCMYVCFVFHRSTMMIVGLMISRMRSSFVSFLRWWTDSII